MLRVAVLSLVVFAAACAGRSPGLRTTSEPLDPQAQGFSLLSSSASASSQDVPGADAGPIMIEIEEFDEPTLNALKKTLDEVKAQGHLQLWIRIDSYGGSVHFGMEMIQAIEDADLQTICVVDSKAMSMGFFLLESEACTERLMTKRSELMAHQPWTQSQGNATDHEDTAARLRTLTRSLLEMAAARMTLTVPELEAKIENRDWYMTWEEALAVKAIDGTVTRAQMPALFKMSIQAPPASLFSF